MGERWGVGLNKMAKGLACVGVAVVGSSRVVYAVGVEHVEHVVPSWCRALRLDIEEYPFNVTPVKIIKEL